MNVLYHITESWNLYANTEGSFGSVQYSQMPNRVTGDEVKPEKSRTWEIGTRHENWGSELDHEGLFSAAEGIANVLATS